MDVTGEQGKVVGELYPAPDRYLLGPHYLHPRGECTWKCTGRQLFQLQEPSHRDPLEEAASAAESSVAERIYREYAKRIGHEDAISALGDTAWMLPWFRAENTPKKARLKRKARMKAALPPRKYLNRKRTELDGSGTDTSGGAGVDSDGPGRAPDAEALSDRATQWAAATGAELAPMIADVELASLDDVETIEYLKAATRLAAWAESRRIGAMHRFTEHRPNMGDESGNFEAFSRYAGGEISAALSISPGSGRHQLGQSWFIYKHLPASHTALSDGKISLAHARMIMQNCPPANADDTARYEHELLDLCEGLSPAQLDKQAMRVSNDINPTSLEDRHQSVRKSRKVTFTPQPDAMTEIYAYLPAVEAAAIEDNLERMARSLQGPDEFRNHTQLKADVFTDLLLGKQSANGTVPRAEVLITIPALTLMGHSNQPGDLEGYGPVPADVARRLAGESKSWYRILTDPFTGSVLAYGRKHKKPPADLKRLLRARDGHCRFPGCNRRPVGCDIDHTKAREDGGLTDHDNCAHLCKAHHKAKHEGGWKLEQLDAGILRWTAPTGHTYKTRPDYTSKPPEPAALTEPGNAPPPF
ncbi:HNH endonuclease signature motif containing protein [Arthrobacter monumenti]